MRVDRKRGTVIVYSGHRDGNGDLLAEREAIADRLRERLPEGQRRHIPRMRIATTFPRGPIHFVTTIPGEEGRQFVDAVVPHLDPDSPTSVWH